MKCLSKVDTGSNRISFIRINKALLYHIIVIAVLRRDRNRGRWSACVHALTEFPGI